MTARKTLLEVQNFQGIKKMQNLFVATFLSDIVRSKLGHYKNGFRARTSRPKLCYLSRIDVRPSVPVFGIHFLDALGIAIR